MNEKKKLTYENFCAVLETLPVSYYLNGETIPVSPSCTAETSYFDPTAGEVVISYSNVLSAVKGAKEFDEELVRGLIYHELSHVLLTPRDLFQVGRDYGLTPTECNIIEDERIETAMQGYYYNTDFVKNKKRILTFRTPASSPEEYLFNSVRGHLNEGHPEVEQKIQEFLHNTASFTSPGYVVTATDDWGGNYLSRMFADLRNFIYGVYKEMHKSKEESKEGNGSKKQGQQSGSGESEKKEQGKQAEQQQEEQKEQGTEEGQGQKETAAVQTSAPYNSKEAIEKKSLGTALIAGQNGGAYALHRCKPSQNIITKAKAIFSRLNPGAGLEETEVKEGYDGDFDPELKMTDFSNRKEWFSEESENGTDTDSRKGKLTLNLWIDNSGSYRRNDGATNAILASLAELEKIVPGFHFNMVRMTTFFEEKTGDMRVSYSSGGNEIPVFDTLYRKVNPTGEERNIVLFDGEATSYFSHYRRLAPMNNPLTTFIVECSNEIGVRANCLKAHIKVQNDDYPSALANNVLEALEQMF